MNPRPSQVCNPVPRVIWVVLAAALLAGVLPAAAQDAPATTPEAPVASSEGKRCGDCHLDLHAAWSTGVHATAFTRESFQRAWTAELNNPACLNCHVTDFEPPTGRFAAENVQCEACHGPTPANHPEEDLVVRTDAGICRDCHVNAFNQWRQSQHAFTEEQGALACATCHEPHTQRLRLGSVDAQCLECHQEPIEGYTHEKHPGMVVAGLTISCASCHMPVHADDAYHRFTDHSLVVTTNQCNTCHESLARSGLFPPLERRNPVVVAERDRLRLQASRLEAQLATIPAEAPSPVQITQGLLLGLGIGIMGVWLVLRRRGNH